MINPYKYKYVLLLTVLTLGSACGEYDQMTIEKEGREGADSLFRKQKDSIVKNAELFCDSVYGQYYEQAIDSLRITKIQKAQKLIEK